MKNVLDDVTDEKVDAQHINRRVDDWVERVKNLYAKIDEWLPDGWTSQEGESVCMHEEMMRRFNVAARQIPTLLLVNGSGNSARLEPRGLWIIGANGRIDMKFGSRHYLIVDVAGSFEAPDWQVADAELRHDRVALTKDWLRHAL